MLLPPFLLLLLLLLLLSSMHCLIGHSLRVYTLLWHSALFALRAVQLLLLLLQVTALAACLPKMPQ
jgi:hypothetical protein